jgi:hypothetical protein
MGSFRKRRWNSALPVIDVTSQSVEETALNGDADCMRTIVGLEFARMFLIRVFTVCSDTHNDSPIRRLCCPAATSRSTLSSRLSSTLTNVRISLPSRLGPIGESWPVALDTFPMRETNRVWLSYVYLNVREGWPDIGPKKRTKNRRC